MICFYHSQFKQKGQTHNRTISTAVGSAIKTLRMKSLILTLALFFSLTTYFAAAPSTTSFEEGDKDKYVTFTLHNGSLKSIPLLIPGVMNPNLSPMSDSGVSLKIGQKILFRYKGKKRVLLLVDDELNGQTLQVHKLLKEKKREIDDQKQNR